MTTTVYDLTNTHAGVVAEVHYKRPPSEADLAALSPEYRDPSVPVVTYNEGLLTTDHAASSHGLPVWLAGANHRTTDSLVPGQAYGPADLPAGYEMVILPYHHLTDERWLHMQDARTPIAAPILAAAKAAGYRVEVGESLPQ